MGSLRTPNPFPKFSKACLLPIQQFEVREAIVFTCASQQSMEFNGFGDGLQRLDGACSLVFEFADIGTIGTDVAHEWPDFPNISLFNEQKSSANGIAEPFVETSADGIDAGVSQF